MAAKSGKTSNYGLFVLHPFNRPLKDRPDIRESMEKHGYWPSYPVLVRAKKSKMEIVAGHHRFNEAVKLGIPVYYRFVNGELGSDPAGPVKTERPWSHPDYLHAHCNTGNEHYRALADYRDRTGFALSICRRLLAARSTSSGAMFESGGFKIADDTSTAADIEWASKKIAEASDLIEKRIARNSRFLLALISACHVPEFDIRRFVKRARSMPGIVVPQPDVHAYLDMIEEVHNYKARTKPSIAHSAKQLARARCGRPTQ